MSDARETANHGLFAVSRASFIFQKSYHMLLANKKGEI